VRAGNVLCSPEGTPLPVSRPAARVWKTWPPDGPSRHARADFSFVEAEPVAVPSKDTTLATVIAARAVTVPPWLLPAVLVPLTGSGHFLLPCG
jgi:hypothetical protein